MSLCPTRQTSPALLKQQKPVGRVAAVWVQAQLEGAVGDPHQGAAEPLCCALLQLHLLPALPGSGQPEVLLNPVWNAAVRDCGRIWFRHQGLQAL